MLGFSLAFLSIIGAVQVARTALRLAGRAARAFTEGCRAFGRALGRACRPVADRRDESTALALTALSAAVAALTVRAEKAEALAQPQPRGASDAGRRQAISVAEVMRALEEHSAAHGKEMS